MHLSFHIRASGPCSPGLLASGELILQPSRRGGDRFSRRPFGHVPGCRSRSCSGSWQAGPAPGKPPISSCSRCSLFQARFLSKLPLSHRTTCLVRRSAAGPLLPASSPAPKEGPPCFLSLCPQSLTHAPSKPSKAGPWYRCPGLLRKGGKDRGGLSVKEWRTAGYPCCLSPGGSRSWVGTPSAMAQGRPSTARLARFCQKLNRLKPLEESSMETSLRRCLSTLDLTLLGVGGMVGSGLYVLTGTVAKNMAGPAVLLSFLVASVASLLAALCYAEFGARVPRTGSAYLFTYVSMGEVWAFLIGWNVLLEYLIGGAAVARAWSGYLDAIFNHSIRNFTESHMGVWQMPLLAHYPDFLAAGILLVASGFVSCGARVSSWLNHTFSAISLIVILFIIVLGFILARPHNWSAEEGGFAPFGFSGILAGTATCFYAFVGFDVIAASSEEARNPRWAVPMATAISLGLAAGAYILVSTVLTLMVPWHSLDPDSALADAFYRRGYSWAGFIVAIGSICGKGPFWAG